MMALTHTETPLKGGINTPLHESDFSSVLPKAASIATPNTVIATPFRTQREGGGAATPAGFLTPASGALVPVAKTGAAANGAATPAYVRDKLSINAEENMGVTETPALYKNYQKQLKSTLREGLSTLPAPRNDYEIVVPEQEDSEPMETRTEPAVEDQADVDARLLAEQEAQRKRELAKRSQVIQRGLPRPTEVNTKILRPQSEKQNLTEQQQAEELIKHEMITMQRE